jgi:hypothetical protein
MKESSTRAVESACLARTRSAVLNVLVATGLGIAISGGLLRWRDRWALFRGPEAVRRGLLATLLGLAVCSYVARRVLCGREALRDPTTRAERFFRGHVIAAAIAALAVPLGLVYGWLDRPRLDAVGPFWVAALALGFLALPRGHELEGFDEPMAAAPESERAD